MCPLKILSQSSLVLPTNIGFVKRFSNSKLQIFLFLYTDFSLSYISRALYSDKHPEYVYAVETISCDEYDSRTLTGKQASSMANTIAINSNQGRQAKPEGSPSLVCSLHPRSGEDSRMRKLMHCGIECAT